MVDEARKIEAGFQLLLDQLTAQIVACPDDPEHQSLRDALEGARAKALEGMELARNYRSIQSGEQESNS